MPGYAREGEKKPLKTCLFKVITVVENCLPLKQLSFPSACKTKIISPSLK